MRESQGRLVVGARAVALTVAVGVAASTGIASMSSASAQSAPSVRASQQCPGYTAAEIILGFMGEGVVAKQSPDLALVHVPVGATPRDVEVFLALATLKEPGFAEKFRADVTSGDPFRVRNGLKRLDTMSVAIHKDVTEKPVDTGTGLRSNYILTIIDASFEEGKSGLTTEKAVVIVTKLLAGK
ncbi:hypothetical protein [Streptomyces graminilatus]|uniref:hypothetical protein n=1 Tax=Streptomyces graminilatus TaxID=1464070 RepID=UPI000B275F46|nr:hypothetical protein [Streptomyces graminilatus]